MERVKKINETAKTEEDERIVLREPLNEYDWQNNIGKLIYTIRNRQVMLDADLAMIYGYEVKYLNRQVRRNINRFPDDFMFQLTKDEVENLRCQIGTANVNSKSRTMPFVFTEQGLF